MKTLDLRRRLAAAGRRGSALLMSFMVLIVLAAIIFQLYIATSTDARVARNDVALTTMDLAIESAMLEVFDRLKTDGEAAAAAEGAGGAGGAGGGGGGFPTGDPSALDGGGGGGGGEGGEGDGGQEQPSDSHEDAWGKPQRTTINDIEMRVLVIDENSKLNVLGMLTEDEEQADLHLERVTRILDLCREDTDWDIDLADARRMAERMKEHFTRRRTSDLPRPVLLTDDEEQQDQGMPLSLRELMVLEPFDTSHFRDFRDEQGRIVHSIEHYLTVWSSLTTHSELMTARGQSTGDASAAAGGDDEPDDEDPTGAGAEGSGAAAGDGEELSQSGGLAVNVNTAPAAVLKALLDDRDVPYRFWDEVIEYRNLEEEEEQDDSDQVPVLDEYGNEVIKRQIFDSLEELSEVDGYEDLGENMLLQLEQFLDTQSHVFSIYVTARRATGTQDDFGGYRGSLRKNEREDMKGNALVRTVRAVIWRYQDGDEVKIVPILRWEVLDYTPFEVQDFPDPDR